MGKMKNTGRTKLYFIIFHYSFIFFAKLLHFGKNTK